MKKILVLILSLMLLASLSTVASAAELGATVVAVRGTPVIGDTVDPIWDTAEFSETEIDNLYYGGGEGEQTAKVKAMYDNDYLYFLAEVTGEVNEFSIYLQESDGNLMWILLDPDGQLYGVDTAKLDPRFVQMKERSTKYSVIMTETGYIFQIGVDTRVDDIRFTDSFQVEFQLASYGANPVGTFGWVAEDMYIDMSVGYPQVFGTMILEGNEGGGFEPDTNPPATNPPATNPPATNPPATNPPATNPPATNPPATNPPATNAPETGDVETGDTANDEDEKNSILPIILAAVAAVVLAVVVVVIVKKKKK